MILAAIRKDVAVLVRDRGALVSLFVLPVIFILAFGSTVRFGADRDEPRRIALFVPSGDARGEAIALVLATTPGIDVRPARSASDARTAVASEAALAGLIVPGQADRPIELVIDRGMPVQIRGPLEGALQGAVVRAATKATHWPPLVEVRNPPGAGDPLDSISSFQVAVPGNAVLFGFFIALSVALVFAGERRSGMLRRMRAAPVPRWKLLAATLVPYYVVGVVQLAFLFGVGALVFDMHVAGSPVALVAISLAVTYCAVALGLLLAAFATTEKRLGAAGAVTLLVMGMLGGCMVPRIVMPPLAQAIGLAVPHGWALDAYYAVLVRSSTTLSDVAPAVAVLLAFGTAFAAFGAARFRCD